MPYLIFAGICIIWGTSFILMKKALLVFGPVSVAGWRVAGGGLVLAALWFASRRRWPLRRRHLVPIMILTLIGYIVPFVIQPIVIARQTSAFMGLMISLVPILTIAVSVPMLRIWPRPREIIGVIGGLACAMVLFADALHRQIPVGDFALAVVVPLGYAIGNVYVKKRFADLPKLFLAAAALVLTSSLVLPVGLVRESVVVPETSRDMWVALGALAILGIFGTGIATHYFYQLIHDHGPLFAGMIAYMVPIGALAWGWGDGEKVSVTQVAALIGVFIMVAVVQYGAASKTPIPTGGEGPAMPTDE